MGKGFNVVIADDDPDIRGLLEIAARRAELTIVSSHGEGGGALAATLDTDPDLLILDVSMPVMTGLEVVHELRASRHDGRPYVLLVSASVNPSALAAGKSAGADDYVMKPFTLSSLVERLRGIQDTL